MTGKRIQPSDAKLEITQIKSYVGQKQNMRVAPVWDA